MLRFVPWLLICSITGAHAQERPAINVFFGADYILHPIAMKSACGGEIDADMARLQALLSAFPEDAKAAGMQDMINALLAADEISELVGPEIAPDQLTELCAAALDLDLMWLTPEGIISTENSMNAEQAASWANFWEIVRTF